MSESLSWERHGASWPNHEASRFVEAAGVRWHVQILGRGPPLLLLHGTGASTHSWASAAPLLAEHFTVVLPDLPGHAFSGAPGLAALSLPGMARALAGLLHTLKIEPQIAAGHSAGAAILIRMAVDKLIAPRGIVSFNGALLPFHGVAGQIFSPLAKLLVLNPFMPQLFAWRAGHRGAVTNLLRGMGSDVAPESAQIYTQLFQSPAHVAATLRMMAQWDLDLLASDMTKLNTPVLLIAADRDTAIVPATAERARSLLPHASVVTMQNAGHLAHEEKPAEAARIVARFARETGVLTN